jgi:hypothetical protein
MLFRAFFGEIFIVDIYKPIIGSVISRYLPVNNVDIYHQICRPPDACSSDNLLKARKLRERVINWE